jgi:TonB family protein
MKTLILGMLVLILALSASSALGQKAPGPLSVIVLSDTQGADFAPYIRQAIQSIDKSWSTMSLQGLPDNSHPRATVRLTIDKDGSVHSMKLVESTHATKLDRAAWGSIVNVGQFPSLPASFSGPSLVLDVDFQVKQ